MEHELKCWPEYFKDIDCREKCFEIRENDRDFKVGDVLLLREYDPHGNMFSGADRHYSGREVRREVVYVTDFPVGLRDGYVCMGLK